MRHTIEIPCKGARVAPALDELESCLEDQGVSSDLTLEMRLIGEEALTNVVKYAGAESMQLVVDVRAGAIILELRDDGRPFDPLDAVRPDLDANLEDRPLGGLGIHMIQSLCDHVRYARDGDTNVLQMEKKR